MKIPLLHRDDDLVVVVKPAGIPTHAPDPSDPCPLDAYRSVQLELGLDYLGMHQRLDAETSGILLFAARPEANRALAAAFEGHAVRKVYLALVHGKPRATQGLIDAPIARDREGGYRVTTPGDRQGQAARTGYRVLRTARLPDAGPGALGYGEVSLLELTPETGRSHQIRVHLQHMGHPVVGDVLYGPKAYPAPQLALHAHSLTLPHPSTGESVTFMAPAPPLLEMDAPALAGLSLSAAGLHVRVAAARAPTALRALLSQAANRRAPLTNDPGTSIYRLVHGAADGLPGLTLDRAGDLLVAGIYDDEDGAPAPLQRPLREALVEFAAGASLYVKFRPRHASRLDEEQTGQLAPAQPLAGADRPAVEAREDGLTYLIHPGEGLSIGLFSDMREGRARVRAWAAGKRVLNTFAYTCGFGVAATAGGAARVLNLDLSKVALAWGQDNYRANGFTPDPYDFVFGDAFDWLGRLGRKGERFDLVILDPPGFARTKTRRFSAAHDYGELAALAAGVTARNGLLLACCNVAELPWRAFRDRVLAGLAGTGRTATVAGIFHEPGLDFPVAAGGEPYLKMLLLRLDPE